MPAIVGRDDTEIERRARELAHQMLSDLRIEEMADRDGERIVRLETHMAHMAEAINKLAESQNGMADKVQKIENIITKASGMKLAFITLGAGLSFILSQVWNYLAIFK